MEDPIERALVWSESNDQLESECVGFKDSFIERGESDSVMHVSHWTPTFEPLTLSIIKPVPIEEHPPIQKENHYLLRSGMHSLGKVN